MRRRNKWRRRRCRWVREEQEVDKKKEGNKEVKLEKEEQEEEVKERKAAEEEK